MAITQSVLYKSILRPIAPWRYILFYTSGCTEHIVSMVILQITTQIAKENLNLSLHGLLLKALSQTKNMFNKKWLNRFTMKERYSSWSNTKLLVVEAIRRVAY